MSSNYPPGVTGNEPEIAGYDEDDELARDNLKAEFEIVHGISLA
jgi:hypothetical protein